MLLTLVLCRVPSTFIQSLIQGVAQLSQIFILFLFVGFSNFCFDGFVAHHVLMYLLPDFEDLNICQVPMFNLLEISFHLGLIERDTFYCLKFQ